MKLHCASCFLNDKPVRKLVRILCVRAHIYYFNFDSKHKDIQKIKYNSRSRFAYLGEVIASSMRFLQSFYQRLGNLRKKKKKKVLKSHIDLTIRKLYEVLSTNILVSGPHFKHRTKPI